MKAAQKQGGINLQIGSHADAKTYRFYPNICLYVGDNQGASATACIKHGATYKPCRICEADRHDIHDFNLDCPYRHTGYCYALQKAGQEVFSKKLKGEFRLTSQDHHVANVCKYE